MNETDEDINYKLFVGEGQVSLTIPAHGIQTLMH
jgi:hypothetical protein